MRSRILLALGVVASFGGASAETAPPDPTAVVMRQVQRCFSPPASPAKSAVIAFRIDAAGEIAGAPEVAEGGDAPADKAFAAAAKRAVLRCAPYQTGGPKDIRITFHAEPAAAPDRAKPAALRLPDGLCEVDRQRGGRHETVWKALTPPSARGVRMERLAVHCPALDGAQKPERIFSVYQVLSPPPEAPKTLESFLQYFYDRYRAQSLDVTRDGTAVFVEQRPRDPKIVSGVSAFTLVDGRAMIFNLFDFGGRTSADVMRADLAAAIGSYR